MSYDLISDNLIKALCDIQDEHQIVDIDVVVDEDTGQETITILRKKKYMEYNSGQETITIQRRKQ